MGKKKLNPAAVELGRLAKGIPKTITPAESAARSTRLAAGRAAITPEAIARRTKTRLANLAAKKKAAGKA